jgi:hypothetical protein
MKYIDLVDTPQIVTNPFRIQLHTILLYVCA